MAMGLNAQYEVAQSGAATNLNQSSDTVLVQRFVPAGAKVRRFGVVGDNAAGLLDALVLKLSYTEDGGANWTDISDETIDIPGSPTARGTTVYKNVGTQNPSGVGATAQESAGKIPVGAIVAVRVSTQAGGTCTGVVFMEVEHQPFAGSNIPDDAVEVDS